MDIELLEITEADLEQIRTWRNSDEVRKFMYNDDIITVEKQKNWFEALKTDRHQKCWLIAYNNEKVGLVSLYGIREQFKHCSWAFYLGNTSHRGAGIGKKVEYRILEMVFDKMKFNKLICEVLEFNDKVIAMHERFGFKREGFFREHVIKDGEFHNIVSLSMLKSEWEVNKDKLKSEIYPEK